MARPRSKRRVFVPGVPVVAAFHALSAEALAKLDHPLDCDALICGDSAEAKTAVTKLAEMIPGVRAIDAGPLDNARLLESAAALLISLNLRHKVKESGMRITGSEDMKRTSVVALAGGVGAARFLDGLTRVIDARARLHHRQHRRRCRDSRPPHLARSRYRHLHAGRLGESATRLGHSRRQLPMSGGAGPAGRRHLVSTRRSGSGHSSVSHRAPASRCDAF